MLRHIALATVPSMRHLDMSYRLKSLADCGFAPEVIYDIGAACGDWSRMAANIWSRAHLVAFEPNGRERASLDATKEALPSFEYRTCFLGTQRRIVRYVDAGTQTSILAGKGVAEAEMLVLDALIESGDVRPPDFLKLDVQGFELEVLRGGEKALSNAMGALLEVSMVPFLDGVPVLAEVVRFMDERRFALYDLAGILRRQPDDALLQLDLLFLQKDHPLRKGGLS